MKFLASKAVGLFNKMKNNLSQTDGESTVKSGLNALAGVGKVKVILIATPIVSVLFILLIVTVSFASELEQAQMNDLGNGKSSTKAGNVNYTEADFEDAVNVCDSSPKFGYFGDVAAGLSGSSFKSVDGYNNFIKENVKKAGFGTREGVVAAAMSLCYELPKATGSKYFYTHPGDATHNGAAREEGISERTYLDCRAFVQWAVYNGGYNAGELEWIGDVANVASVKGNVRDVQPGDIFSTSGYGHIWLVVGVDSNGYYAAEEFGGAEINYYTFDQPLGTYPGSQSAQLYDMSAYYSNPANVRGH